MDLDQRVNSVVNKLNQLPTVDTFSSCGGHENPEEGQATEGHFYVNFWVDDWSVLERLSFVAARFLGAEETPGEFGEYAGSAQIVAWWNGDWGENGDWDRQKGALCFELAGNCDPDMLAAEISKWCRDLTPA